MPIEASQGLRIHLQRGPAHCPSNPCPLSIWNPIPTTTICTASATCRSTSNALDLAHTQLSKIAVCSPNAIEEKPNGPTAEEQATTSTMFKNLVMLLNWSGRCCSYTVARQRELLSELSVWKEKESSRRTELSRREKEEDEQHVREVVEDYQNQQTTDCGTFEAIQQAWCKNEDNYEDGVWYRYIRLTQNRLGAWADLYKFWKGTAVEKTFHLLYFFATISSFSLFNKQKSNENEKNQKGH